MGYFFGKPGAFNITSTGFFGGAPAAPPPGPGQFVAVGSDGFPGSSTTSFLSVRSGGPSGTWTPVNVAAVFGANGLFCVAHAIGQWIAATDASSGTSVIATSPDGITWTPRVNPDTAIAWRAAGGDAHSANFGGDLQNLLASPDGITWTDTNIFLGGSFVVAASAAGGGNYVVTGVGSSAANHGFSANGTLWATSSFATQGGQSVIWDGTQFVSVCIDTLGNTILATSPTGVVWTPTTPLAFTNAQFIAFNGTTYVLAAHTLTATAATIAGLVTATPVATIPNQIEAITAGGGVFVMVDNFAVAYSSVDGVTWVTENTGISSAEFLFAVAFG